MNWIITVVQQVDCKIDANEYTQEQAEELAFKEFEKANIEVYIDSDDDE